MAIWVAFLLFECGTAENGRVQTEGKLDFSNHQQWFAAFHDVLSARRYATAPCYRINQMCFYLRFDNLGTDLAGKAAAWTTRKKRPRSKSKTNYDTPLFGANRPPVVLCPQMQSRCIEGDRRGVRHIERLDGARHVEPRKCADGFARLLPQPLALGAKHQRHLVT